MSDPIPRASTKENEDNGDDKHLPALVTCQSFRSTVLKKSPKFFNPFPALANFSSVPEGLCAACDSPGHRLLANPHSRTYLPSLPIEVPTISAPWNVTGWHEEKHLIN